MVRVVMPLLAGLLLPAAALALGPAQPFLPPGPPTAAPAGNDASHDGLAGVRLGKAPAALIDGHWLRTGDAARGGRVQRIDAHGAWLQHADGRRERLALDPALPDPSPAAPAPSSPPAPAPDRAFVSKRNLP